MSCSADITISVLSVEYVKVPVRATVDGAPYNPTGDSVELAMPPHDAPPSNWFTGSWETSVNGEYLARALIGPGTDFELSAGYYDVWVRVTDNPEVPVIEAGILLIV